MIISILSLVIISIILNTITLWKIIKKEKYEKLKAEFEEIKDSIRQSAKKEIENIKKQKKIEKQKRIKKEK